ncbi:MAG TPA: outer membrane beta-barrel protein [Gemmatimonadaceae bacterium]|nr:outer membrane beta-barrel protein [Gemmatimonadaceae bacterium]
MKNRFAVLGCLALALTASAADAQRGSRPIEFGVDGGLTVAFDDPTVTLVSLPVQDFRVGFFMTDRVSIEPRFHLNSQSTDGGSFQEYHFELGALFHPGGYRTGSGLYIRPFGGIVGFNSEATDDSDGYLGAGIGIKLPFSDRRFATRLEANFSHLFSEGDGSNRLGLLFGLSFFK